MLPTQSTNLIEPEVVEQSSRTYRLDISAGTISGTIDGLEAIKQAVQKILCTERYAFVIYSSEYGVELERLIGQNFDFIRSDLERTITEALLVDERILGISEFTISQASRDSLSSTFTVETTAGAVTISTEVQVL